MGAVAGSGGDGGPRGAASVTVPGRHAGGGIFLSWSWVDKTCPPPVTTRRGASSLSRRRGERNLSPCTLGPGRRISSLLTRIWRGGAPRGVLCPATLLPGCRHSDIRPSSVLVRGVHRRDSRKPPMPAIRWKASVPRMPTATNADGGVAAATRARRCPQCRQRRCPSPGPDSGRGAAPSRTAGRPRAAAHRWPASRRAHPARPARRGRRTPGRPRRPLVALRRRRGGDVQQRPSRQHGDARKPTVRAVAGSTGAVVRSSRCRSSCFTAHSATPARWCIRRCPRGDSLHTHTAVRASLIAGGGLTAALPPR